MLVQHGYHVSPSQCGLGGQEEVYVGCFEPGNIPIGEDDTQESRMCVFYRDWPYRRKFGSIFLCEKSNKMTNLACFRLSEELFEV